MLVVVFLAVSSSADAQPLSVERPASIAVAPDSFRVFGPIEDADFEYDLAEDFRGEVHRYIANHDEIFASVSPTEVRDAYRAQPRFETVANNAAEFAKYGFDNYKQLRSKKAIDQLQQAVERYEKIDYEVVEPERVAKVLMYLALSHLNEGDNPARPLALMERLVRLDPSRTMRPGFYPDRIARFYRSAREDVVRRLLANGPREGRAQRMLELTGADFAIFGGAFQTDREGYRVQLRVYSKPGEGFLEPVSMRVVEPTASKLRAAASRLMSRLAPCFYKPDEERNQGRTVIESSGQGPFSMHLTFAYASFLDFPKPPIQKPFGNAGAGIGANLALTDEFGVGVAFQMLSSIRDYSGRILGGFSTIRMFGGPDLGIDVGNFNFGLSAFLEGTRIGDFVLCTEPDEAPPACTEDAHRKRYSDLDLFIGLNSRPRIRYRLFKSFELVAAASFSLYLVPAERPLNNPFSGEFGVRYRF